MKRTFIPNVGSLFTVIVLFISGSLFAQNYVPTAGSDTILFYPSDGMTSISDPGGPGGSSSTCGVTGSTSNNYTSCNCHTIIRLCPDIPGEPLTLNFSEFGVVNPDYFVVYDGADTNAAVLYNNNTNAANSNDRCYGPRFIRATNPDGCLTVRLFANGSTNEVGFLASVSIPAPVDAGIAALRPDGAVTAGANNIEVQVENHGTSAINNVTIQWTLNGVAQTSFNYVGSVAPGQTSPFFTIGNAVLTGSEAIKVWTSLPNNVADTVNTNDTLSRQFCIGMAGTYTIDLGAATGGTNFANFADAVSSLLSCGVSGPVVFNVAPGSYVAQVTIPAITGASAINTITFRSTSTDSTLVKIQHAASSSAAANFVLTLNGARYVTFERITFERTGSISTYQSIVELTNSATGNSFINCQFIAPLPTTTSSPERRTSIYAANGALHSGTTVRNSYFSGNSFAVSLDGVAGVTGDIVFEGNTISSAYSGITLVYQRNVTIHNNTISRQAVGATTAYSGIYFESVQTGSILGNRISTQSGGEYGIRFIGVQGSAGSPFLVANNFIQTGGTASGTARGISLEGGSSYIDILFNSTNITGGSATSGRAFHFDGGPNTAIRLFNNNLINSVSGYSIYVDGAAAAGALTTDYNNLYTEGAVLGYWNGTFANNFPLLKLASSQDTHSQNVDPDYTSFNNLHAASGVLNGTALPFASVTTDIDGDVRDAQNPDIGADEFLGLGVDAGVVDVVSPTYPAAPGTYNLDVKIGNFGTTPLTSATIQWQLNGVPQPDFAYSGNLLTGEFDTVTLTSFTPGSGDQVKVWSSMPNGVADADNSNDTTNLTLCISLVGTFTINSALPTGSGNFASFTDAATALGNCGIGGPVIFNVVPGNGPFTEQVTIPVILGVSATNTVTFNCFGDTLQFDAPTANKYILRLDGAKYVTIDSLYIRTLSSTFGFGILFSNDASYNTIRRSHIDLTGPGMSSSSANTGGIVFSNSTSSLSSAGNNGSYNLIENNLLRYGAYAIRTNDGGSRGNRFVDNVMEDHYSTAIYIAAGNDSTLIEGNDISRPTRTNSTTFQGIYLTGVSQNCLIKGNSVHHTNVAMPTNSSSVYAYNSSSTVDATVGNENVWVNNLAYDLNNNGVTYGFYNEGSDGAHYFHNTVVNDNQNATSSSAAKGFNQSGEGHNIKIIGNIFYVTRSGSNGFKSAVTYGSTNSTIESDYNVFFVSTTGATTNLGQYGTSGLFLTLADWQQLGFDLHSYQVDPYFVDTTNHDFTPQNPFFNNILPNQGFAEDFFGTARAPLTDPGAIEFFGLPNDVGVVAFVSPSAALLAGTQNVEVEVRNFGTNTVNSFDVQWAINGVVQGTVSYATPLAPSTNATIVLGTYTAVGGEEISAWTLNPNAGADAFPLNDTLTLETCLGMAGNYTIDAGQATAGTNYASFEDAIDALLVCGVAGPVVFDVVQGSGPYTEQPIVPNVSGVSAVNTITFNGNGDTLQFATTSSLEYVIKLSGAKHVILNDLVIRPLATSNGFGILLRDGCDSVSITNNTIDLSLVSSTSGANATGIVISGSNSSTTTNAPLTASNTLIENNLFISGVHAISIIGSEDGTGAVGNRIIGNTIQDYYTDGISLHDNTNTLIRGNDISRPTRTTAPSAVTGIKIEGGAFGTIIDGNRIHNTHGSAPNLTTSVYPIFVTSNDVPVGQEVIIMNNLIYDIGTNGLINGIYNLGSEGNFIYNNTIVLDNANTTGTGLTRGIWQSSVATNIEIMNNIVYITRGTTGDKWGIHLNTAASDVDVDGNVYYVAGASGNNFIGYYDGVSYATIQDWQTANNGAFDQNGFQRNPRFVDAANGDFTPTSTVIDNQALPLAAVTTDIFGTPRSATPDPGAIEFVPLADDASVVELLSPMQPFAPGNYPIDVVIQNLGALDITEVEIWVNINDGVTDTTFPVYVHAPIVLPSTESDTVTIGNYDFTSNSYTITIWTANPNGGADGNPGNDTLVVNVCLALAAGNYTIDAGSAASATNFTSFNSAVAALSCGILGDVTIDVVAGSGPYNEQVTIPEIAGAGPAATVTFNGNGNTLTHDGSVKFATLLLNGPDYVTFNNLTVQTTSFGQGFGIQLMNAADHNTIRNVTVLTDVATTNNANYGIVASSSEIIATADGNNCNYLLVDNVTVRGGYGGIRLEGFNGGLLKANRIINSTFLHQYNHSIYVDDADSLIVHGNVVDSLRDATNADGMWLSDVNGYFEVTANNVSSQDYGIYMIDANTADSTRRALIANNMVRSASDVGLYLVTVSHTNIYHNTVRSYLAAINMLTDSRRLNIRNNIFYSTNSFALEDEVATGTSNHVDIDNNIYFGSGTNPIRFGGTSATFDYPTLAAWRSAFPLFNQNSIQGDPVFASASDLHLLGTLANDVGDNTAGITVDIDGDTRPMAPSTTVDIGADEYTPFTSNILVFDIIEPENNTCGDSSTTVSVVLYNQGTQPQGNFTVQADITGAGTATISTVYVGPIAPQTYDTVAIGTFNSYAGGVFNIFVEQLLATDQYGINDTLSETVTLQGIPAAPVLVGDTGCVGDFLELTADMTGFVDIIWYDDAALTNVVGSGDVVFTPGLTTSTTYYAVGFQGVKERLGKPAPTSTGTTGVITTPGWGMEFGLTETLLLDSLTIYPDGNGMVSLAYYDLNNGNVEVASTAPIAVSGNGSTPVKLKVGWVIQPGRYSVGFKTATGISTFARDLSGATFPYTAPTLGIQLISSKLGFTLPSTSSYYWFYDWVVRRPGCTSPAASVVAFISSTQSDAGPNDTICRGETATLTAQNGVAWLWTGGLNTQTINVSPTTTTTYSLTVTDAFGCTGTVDQTTVIVNQLPTVSAGNDTAVCAGESATLAASGASSYVWSNTATTQTITVSTAGVYSVTGTDANGCVNSDDVELTVNALPTGNAGADEEICEGASVQLLATGGVAYVWSTTETTADITVSPTTTTSYNLTTTDQFGCVGEDTVTVVVNPLPVISITVSDTICITQTSLTLAATPAGGTFTGPGVSGGVFDASLVGVGTYTLTYSYTDGNGCSNTATKDVVVDASPSCTPGVGNVAGLAEIGVYPNPFQDKVSLQFTATSNQPVTISMYNLLGQVIFTADVEVTYGLNNYTIDTDRSLAEGFYVIELRKGEEAYLEKLLRVR